MPRVKRGTMANKRRKKMLKQAKGFMWTRKNKYRQAKEALYHAWVHQLNDRRKKKGNFRRLWQIQIGAATRELGIPYNKFINGLKKSKIELDRKVLSDIAQNNPEVFRKIAEMAKSAIGYKQ